MTQPEVRKFTAPVTEKAQTGDDIWKVSFQIAELSKNYPTVVYRVPTEDANKLEPKKTYYISLVKGRLKDGKDATKDYNYFWDWGGIAVEVLPEGEPGPGAASGRPGAPMPDPKADSIERQTALKVAGELYAAAVPYSHEHEAAQEALVLARRLVNYFFGVKS